MKYIWNPQYDIFCLQRRVDFIGLNHEISFTGDGVAKAIASLIDNLKSRVGGITRGEVDQVLKVFSASDIDLLWQTLTREKLVQNSQEVKVEKRLNLPKMAKSQLLRDFPTSLSNDSCYQLGFRFGGLYFLATPEKKFSASWLARQIIEWAFDGKWLERARPFFWQTGERVIAGEQFLSPRTMKWLKSTINALLISDKNNYLHEIDLRSFKIKQELLLSNTSPVGVLAPIIWQEDIRNPNNQAVFSPALSIVISRYRQSSTWENRRPHLACGAHHDPTIARSISTAEAIERSAAAAWQADSLDFGRLQDDPRRILPLTLIDLDQEQQKDAGLSPFEPQKSYYWRNAIDLIRGEEVQIIADLCYFPFDPPLHEYRFAWGNSSGMAAGRTLLEAQKSALLELIERDAFMVNWILKRSTPRIPHSLVPIDIRESQNQMESIGYRTSLLDITLRGVPTVLGIAYRSEWPAVILGAAARNTLLEAACAAWKEVEVGLYCRLIDPTMEENTKPLLEAKDVQGSEDHAKFFNHPCNMSLASFLWESKKETERPMDQPYFKDSDHQDIVSYCQQLNIDQMYMVDYGSMCGFEVVRLLTPNLVPLTFGYNQLPYRQVLHSSLLDIPSDVLSDVFPVHPFD